MDSVQDQTMNTDNNQMVFFRLAQEQFALEIQRVKEIVRLPATTKLPKAPSYINGIANLRGNILPILDTRERLALEASGPTEQSRVLVTEVAGHLMGLLVDSVLTVKEVEADSIKPPPPVVQTVDREYLSGVVQKDEEPLTMILNVNEVAKLQIEAIEGKAGQHGGLSGSEGKKQTVTIDEVQLVTFSLGREDYAFEVETVQEIMRVGNIADVPNAPPHIKGLITVRENVMPAFDLRTLLNLNHEVNGEHERILIVETGEFTLGMIVDQVREVRRYPKSIIQSPPDSENAHELKGIVKVDNGKKLIMILRQEMLLSDDENKSISQWMDSEGMDVMEENNDRQADGREQAMADEVQLVTFNIGDEEYGIFITQIQEINRLGKITRLPKSPDFIEGVTNLRGEVIPVIDTRKRFGLELRDNDDRTRIIIVDMAGKKTGLIADRVNEVLRLPTSNISPPPPIMSARSEAQFLSGIGKLDNGERMVLLLDSEKILDIEEQQVLQQIAGAANEIDDKEEKPEKAVKPAKKKAVAKKTVTKKTAVKKSKAKTTTGKKTAPRKKAKKKLTIAE